MAILRRRRTSAGVRTSPRPSLRVLVVESQPYWRRLITSLLENAGMRVVGAVSDPTGIPEALATARADYGGVDVVVVDHLEATRMLPANLPVVLYSGAAGWFGDAPTRAGIAAEVSKLGSPPFLAAAVRKAGGVAR